MNLPELKVSARLDCSGHLCPVPITMTEERMSELQKGQVLEVTFTDPGAVPDLKAWCEANGHECLGFRKEKRTGIAYIRKA